MASSGGWLIKAHPVRPLNWASFILSSADEGTRRGTPSLAMHTPQGSQLIPHLFSTAKLPLSFTRLCERAPFKRASFFFSQSTAFCREMACIWLLKLRPAHFGHLNDPSGLQTGPLLLPTSSCLQGCVHLTHDSNHSSWRQLFTD